jgi:hypothetical protein
MSPCVPLRNLTLWPRGWLPCLNLTDLSLLSLWKELFGREAPPNLRRDLMTSILAY